MQSNWTSSDATTARTTHSGLVTAILTGSFTLTAIYQTSQASTTILVNPSLVSSPAISACGMIETPGSYVLAGDISQVTASGPCLTITVGAVRLDCHNHHVSGVAVSGVSDVTMSNCVVAATATSLNSSVIVQDSSSVTLDHDSATGIGLSGGHDNSVLDCTIDGGYTGSGVANAGDDGILLTDETSDRIEGNTIQNVFDAGIEGVDVVANTVIANNTIINAANAGIASYWCTSWTADTVSGNTDSGSTNLVNFTYQVGRNCPDATTPGAFINNGFTGNVLRNPRPNGPTGGAMRFDFGNLLAAAVFGNLIQNNDMGGAPGPYTVPASGFVDGGGNICAPSANSFCGG